MKNLPNGAVTSCSYEYRNNPDGTVTETKTTCANPIVPRVPTSSLPEVDDEKAPEPIEGTGAFSCLD